MERGDDEFIMSWVGLDEDKIDCDVVIFNKFLACLPEHLRRIQQQKGTKIIVDVDDYWHLPEWHINYDHWEKMGQGKIIEDNIRLADLVICASMKIQELVQPINKNTVVIPNAFPFGQENYQPIPYPHEKLTFLYAGGSTHLPDVKLLKGPFRTIGDSKNWKDCREQCEFLLAGYDPSKLLTRMKDGSTVEETVMGVWDHMSTVFKYTKCSRTLPTKELDEYINYYDRADVALIPLRDDPWNSAKSVLKILEAASKRIPVICSRVAPYTELADYPGIMWVDEPKDWLTHIRWCMDNREQLPELGNRLADRVWTDYHLGLWNQVRKQVLHSLVKEKELV